MRRAGSIVGARYRDEVTAIPTYNGDSVDGLVTGRGPSGMWAGRWRLGVMSATLKSSYLVNGPYGHVRAAMSN